MHKSLLAEEESTFEEGLVEIVCGAGNDGLWFQGPKKVHVLPCTSAKRASCGVTPSADEYLHMQKSHI